MASPIMVVEGDLSIRDSMGCIAYICAEGSEESVIGGRGFTVEGGIEVPSPYHV